MNNDDKNEAGAASASELTAEQAEALRADLKAKDEALAKKDREIMQAQHTIIELKKKPHAETAPLAADIESVKRELQEAQKEELEKFRLEQSRDSFEEILSTFSSDPEEAARIREAYESSVMKTGFDRASIRSDLENAFVIANKPKVEKTISELRHAAISKGTHSGGSASGQPPSAQTDSLSEAERAWAKATARQTGKTEAEIIAALMANRQRGKF
jgi:hypothetical protein